MSVRCVILVSLVRLHSRLSDRTRPQIAIFYIAALGAGLLYYLAVSIFSRRALKSKWSLAEMIQRDNEMIQRDNTDRSST